MPIKTLPANPSLDHLKHQARDLQKALRAREPQAAQRVREFHPVYRDQLDAAIFDAGLSLSDAQLALAREYAFASWAKLKAYVESASGSDASLSYEQRIPDPTFRQAVELLDAGDEAELRTLLRDHPLLVRQRVFFDAGSYFGSPSLLEFIAENPIRRGTLPSNVVQMATLLFDTGAVGASETLGLVVSGRIVREQGFQIPLINLLCDHGADPNSAMLAAIGHGEFDAVEALIRRGAHVDLPTAVATDRFEEAEILLPKATSKEKHLAFAYAAQFGRTEALRLLLEAGENPSRFNPVGAHSHSTPLHQAALYGHLAAVRLLVEHGADRTIQDILYRGTPLGWAEHAGQAEVADYLRS